MGEERDFGHRLVTMLYWLAAIAAALAFFYGLDHAVMAVQGLPLGWDLTPAQ